MGLKKIREKVRRYQEGNYAVMLTDSEIGLLFSLIDRARECIKASAHALRSYQYGNSSPDLAEAIADKAESILRELEG